MGGKVVDWVGMEGFGTVLGGLSVDSLGRGLHFSRGRSWSIVGGHEIVILCFQVVYVIDLRE